MQRDLNLINNYSSCYLKVYIGGNEVDAYRYRNIMDITIDETMSGSNMCTINIDDTDSTYINDGIFIEDIPISVEMDEVSTNKLHRFDGYISAMDVNFNAKAISMAITCMDNSHRLNREKKSRTWDNTTSIDAVTSILGEYGFTLQSPVYSAFKLHETLSQSEQTDLEFIESLLDDESVPCYFKMIDAKTAVYDSINFKKTPTADLHYRISPYEIVSMDLSVDREQMKEGTTVSDVDIQNKAVISSRASIFQTSPITNGIKAVTTSTPVDTGYNAIGKTSTPFYNSELQTEADKELMKNELMTIKGEIDVLLTPDTNSLSIGDTAVLHGLGVYLSGTYLITGIRRTVNLGGYQLSLSVSKTGFCADVQFGTLNASPLNPRKDSGVPTDSGTGGIYTKDSGSSTASGGIEQYTYKDGVQSLSTSFVFDLNDSTTKSSIEEWARKYYNDNVLYCTKYNHGSNRDASFYKKIEDEYVSYYMKQEFGMGGKFFQTVGGDFRSHRSMLSGKIVPSSYDIGYVYTVPGMSLLELASRICPGGASVTRDQTIEKGEGVPSMVSLSYESVAKMIIYGNLSLFKDIVGLNLSTEYGTDIDEKIVMQYLYRRNHNRVEHYVHEAMDGLRHEQYTFPTGTKIDLSIFQGSALLSAELYVSVLGYMLPPTSYPKPVQTGWCCEDNKLYGKCEHMQPPPPTHEELAETRIKQAEALEKQAEDLEKKSLDLEGAEAQALLDEASTLRTEAQRLRKIAEDLMEVVNG